MSPSDRRYTLHNVIYAIRPANTSPYPRVHPELWLFALLTDVHAQHRFRVELVLWERPGEERSLYTSRDVIVNLGTDPLLVHGVRIRLRNLLFPRAGLYEFRLGCDGEIIARETILLQEVSP